MGTTPFADRYNVPGTDTFPGKRTSEVLREHGYADAEVDAYVAAGVIEDASHPA